MSQLSPGVGADPPPQILADIMKKQGYTAVPLTRTCDASVFLVRVTLDDHPFTLSLDTGSSLAITLTKAAGKKLGFAAGALSLENEPGSGAVPDKKNGTGYVQTVNFDGADYRAKGSYPAQVKARLTLDYRVTDPKSGKDDSVSADGLLGLGFLHEHSAVIDHDTATLYLIPLARKDGPRLLGRWECVGGERDGKPVDKASERWVEFGKDETATLHLDGNTASGNCTLVPRVLKRYIYFTGQGKGDTVILIAHGAYQVEGERLKLCLWDEPVEPKVVKWEGGLSFPVKLEATKDSGCVLYEFKRVKAERR